MNPNEIKKAFDILDKFDFFNQRAGRELWSDKPKDIQDKDIQDFSNDVKFLKDFINQLEAEVDKLQVDLAEAIRRHLNAVDAYLTAKSDVIKEFAHLLIDKSENGVISIADLPEYVEEMRSRIDEGYEISEN